MAGSLLLDDRGSYCPQLWTRIIRHAIDCDKLGNCTPQRPFKLSCRKSPWPRGGYAAVARLLVMFFATIFGKSLVLVFACVMLHAGSSSADQLKMRPQPVVLNVLKYFQQSSCLAFLALFSSPLRISPLFKHIRFCSVHDFGVLKGCSDASLNVYTRRAADWPCGRAEPRLKPSRHHSDV